MISQNTLMIIILIIFILISETGVILLSRWVYLDARIRKINPWPWIILMVLVSPNFIGLVLYTLVRQKKGGLTCPSCKTDVPPGSSYCPRCGSKLDDTVGQLKSPSPVLLITGFACIVAGFIIFLLSFMYSPDIWLNFNF